MNLRALRVFVGLMDLGTLTGATARLNLSQSAGSRLLSLLEGELGTPLFLRERRRMSPTEAAEALYPEALRILAQIDALPAVVGGAKGATPLRVICHSRLAGGLVLPAIAAFARDRPDRPIRLETAPRRELARRVLAGRYDLAAAVLPLPLGAATPVVLGRVRLDVLMARDHRLAGAASLDLEDLRGTPYIALDETTAVRRIVDAALEEVHRPPPAFEVSTGAAAYRLVAAGLGFTFADPIALEPELTDRVALVPWRREVTLALGSFRLDSGEDPDADRFEMALKAAFDR